MKVTLYHGSKEGLNGPISPFMSDGMCDFGTGFYMGTDPHQPQTLICEEKSPTFYRLSLELDGLKTYRFEVGIDWALFVAFNRGRLAKYSDTSLVRRYQEIRATHDLIFGKIADDRMFAVMGRFFEGLIGDVALVKAIAALQIGDQYCAITEAACRQIAIEEEKRFSAVELENLRVKCGNQRRRGAAEADRIVRQYRREGDSFEEILAREIQKEGAL